MERAKNGGRTTKRRRPPCPCTAPAAATSGRARTSRARPDSAHRFPRRQPTPRRERGAAPREAPSPTAARHARGAKKGHGRCPTPRCQRTRPCASVVAASRRRRLGPEGREGEGGWGGAAAARARRSRPRQGKTSSRCPRRPAPLKTHAGHEQKKCSTAEGAAPSPPPTCNSRPPWRVKKVRVRGCSACRGRHAPAPHSGAAWRVRRSEHVAILRAAVSIKADRCWRWRMSGYMYSAKKHSDGVRAWLC